MCVHMTNRQQKPKGAPTTTNRNDRKRQGSVGVYVWSCNVTYKGVKKWIPAVVSSKQTGLTAPSFSHNKPCISAPVSSTFHPIRLITIPPQSHLPGQHLLHPTTPRAQGTHPYPGKSSTISFGEHDACSRDANVLPCAV